MVKYRNILVVINRGGAPDRARARGQGRRADEGAQLTLLLTIYDFSAR